MTNPFGGRGEGTQLCTPGLVCFQKKSGARDGGWLNGRTEEQSGLGTLSESDLNIARENRETNFGVFGVGPKAFQHLEMEIFSTSVTESAESSDLACPAAVEPLGIATTPATFTSSTTSK
jgi:hypothetical protein